jgi:hypothetical protein
MNATTTTATRWAGWHRPTKHAAWLRLVDAEDYSDCWSRLLDATADKRGGESIVVAAGTDPNRGASRSKPR